MPVDMYDAEAEEEIEYDDMCKPIVCPVNNVMLDVEPREVDIRKVKGKEYIELLLGEEKNDVTFIKPTENEYNFGKTYDFSQAECPRHPNFDYEKLDAKTIRDLEDVKQVYALDAASAKEEDEDIFLNLDEVDLFTTEDLYRDDEIYSDMRDSELDPETLELEKRLAKLTDPDGCSEMFYDLKSEEEVSVNDIPSHKIEVPYDMIEEEAQQRVGLGEIFKPEEVKVEKKRKSVGSILASLLMFDCMKANVKESAELTEGEQKRQDYINSRKSEIGNANRKLRDELIKLGFKSDANEPVVAKTMYANGKECDVMKGKRDLRSDFRISKHI